MRENDTATNVKLMNDYYYGHNGQKQDYPKAFEYGLKAAEAGDADAQCRIAFMYQEEQGVKADAGQEIFWYHKAAEGGNTYAQTAMGWKYVNGLGVEVDLEQAFFWYHKAAEAGNKVAMGWVGGMYRDGRGVAQKDEKKSFEFYKRAADLGCHESEYTVGMCYLNATGTEKDEEKARVYGSRAIQYYLGKVNAGKDLTGDEWHRLGAAYDSGTFIGRDSFEARKCFEKSAAKNRPYGQSALGRYYEKGKGGLQIDYAEALRYYTLALQHGVASAYFGLAGLYYSGKGVAEDKKQAAGYYQNASDRGRHDATLQLAKMYATGDGIPKNHAKAVELYTKAADAGHGQAKKWLKENAGPPVADDGNLSDNTTPDVPLSVYDQLSKCRESAGIMEIIVAKDIAKDVAMQHAKWMDEIDSGTARWIEGPGQYGILETNIILGDRTLSYSDSTKLNEFRDYTIKYKGDRYTVLTACLENKENNFDFVVKSVWDEKGRLSLEEVEDKELLEAVCNLFEKSHGRKFRNINWMSL